MRYVFVVDTEQYSGNFERWLCGYMTGRTDEPETHGGEEAEIAKKEITPEAWDYFQEHVINCAEQPDDCPIDTPVIIYPTPGWFNTGMGGHFKEGQEEEAYKHYKKTTEKYIADHKGMTTLQVSPKLNKFPAYQSVGIFFDEAPSHDIIALLKARAHKFAEQYWPAHRIFGQKITITGFRLLEEKKVVTEKVV